MDTPNTEKPVTHPHLSQHDRDRLDDGGLVLDAEPANDDDPTYATGVGPNV